MQAVKSADSISSTKLQSNAQSMLMRQAGQFFGELFQDQRRVDIIPHAKRFGRFRIVLFAMVDVEFGGENGLNGGCHLLELLKFRYIFGVGHFLLDFAFELLLDLFQRFSLID